MKHVALDYELKNREKGDQISYSGLEGGGVHRRRREERHCISGGSLCPHAI